MADVLGSGLGIKMMALAGDPIGDLTNFFFFKTINNFLRDEIDVLQWNLLTRSATIIGFVATVVLTVWIMFQGFRIVTGQSRQPMMVLVGDSLRAVLIVFMATSMAAATSPLYWTLSDGLSSTIARYVTGDGSGNLYESIDRNLAGMEASMAIIDTIDTGGDAAVEAAKDRDRWFTGIGIAGPSVVAGSMLLLNKIALALFIGFGPIFIMCLLFEQTKSLFSKWLFYGIGTMFSLALLSVMVGIAMKMMTAVTAAFTAKYLVTLMPGMDTGTDGINSMALQQGGLGLLLSTLIVMAPPMAAAFFQGTLGQFASYSSFGTIGASSVAARQQQALAQGRPYDLPPPVDQSRPSSADSARVSPFLNHSLPNAASSTASSQKDQIKPGPGVS